jgi:hypothetical protein
MPNRLNIPDELAPLIEKREQSDRREGCDDSASPVENLQAQQEGAEQERRHEKDRRTEDHEA